MIHNQAALTYPMPATEPATGSNAGEIFIVTVIACAIGAFFYFDLGRFLWLDALKENRDLLSAFTEANSAAAVGSFIYAYAGRQLGTINSLKEIASPNVIIAFVLLGLLTFVPSPYKRFFVKQA